VIGVQRTEHGPVVTDSRGWSERYDHVVMAAHADQTLAMLTDASMLERTLLGAFRYSRNLAVLHTDASFMPKRRAVWSSWNYIGSRNAARDDVCVTYWMNRLQRLPTDTQLFVTLNPPRPPHSGTLLHSEVYDHPIFRHQGDCGAAAPLALARRTQYLVLRRAFRRRDSTRTGCRRGWRSPRNSAACGGPGACRTSPAVSR
jgi:predicted NAD/FAD-binding protein